MNQMILKIDDDTDLLMTPSSIQCLQGRLVGTKSYYGKCLILIMTSLDKEALQSQIDCSILAVEGEKIDQSKIQPFMLEIEGEEVTDLTGKLQTYAGKRWIY